MFSNGFPKEWSTLRKLMWLYRCALAAQGKQASNKVGTAKVGTAKCE